MLPLVHAVKALQTAGQVQSDFLDALRAGGIQFGGTLPYNGVEHWTGATPTRRMPCGFG